MSARSLPRPGAAAALLCAAALGAGCGSAGSGTPAAQTVVPDRDAAGPIAVASSRARAVEPDVGAPSVTRLGGDVRGESGGGTVPTGLQRDPEEALAVAPAGTAAAGPSPGAPTDEEIKQELRQLDKVAPRTAYVTPEGEAVAPIGAPLVVRQLIAAGNAIAHLPYVWGGGHARLYDSGYDCSGSLSFAFINAGLLNHTMAAGWSKLGVPGNGKWLTWYTSSGHVWMIVAGLRFDTSALHIAGSRWTTQGRSMAGFTSHHLPGL
jgi:hypothetical protein